MKVSGHSTDSMFRRYSIVEEYETAAALRQADAWLSTQPLTRNVAIAGLREKRTSGRGKSRTLRESNEEARLDGAGGGT